MSEATIPTADVAVLCDDDILLITRQNEPFRDKLVLPGGHVDPGETPIEAARRELHEETGLDLPLERFSFLVRLDREGRDPRPGVRISDCFLVRVSEEEAAQAKPGTDARQIHWEPSSELVAEDMGFDHFDAILALRQL